MFLARVSFLVTYQTNYYAYYETLVTTRWVQKSDLITYFARSR
jgi:hypothetical protein